MTDGSVEALNREQLDRLASYFDEEVIPAPNYIIPWAKVQRPATR
jgi:hypothetical protein